MCLQKTVDEVLMLRQGVPDVETLGDRVKSLTGANPGEGD